MLKICIKIPRHITNIAECNPHSYGILKQFSEFISWNLLVKIKCNFLNREDFVIKKKQKKTNEMSRSPAE